MSETRVAHVRMSATLYDELRELARKESRTMSAQSARLLDEAVRRHGNTTKKKRR